MTVHHRASSLTFSRRAPYLLLSPAPLFSCLAQRFVPFTGKLPAPGCPGEKTGSASMAYDRFGFLITWYLDPSRYLRLRGFSIERLLKFLNMLNRDVIITLRPPTKGHQPGVRVMAIA
jgi:hypothetical protein